MMQEEVELSLNNFYIFNPTFGAKEGEEDKKILFYYPPKVDVNKQIKIVGLSEAIIKFTSNFICQEECKSVHTLKTRQYFCQPEPNYWMVMTLNIPYTKSKNGLKDITYHGENVHDDVYHSLLKQAYDMYNLFLGPFQSLVEDGCDTINLKLKLHQFLTRYLPTLNISNCDILDVFQGMQFLPLDKRTYLHAQSFMNLFQCEFNDQVEFSALLVKHHLVWSNIEVAPLRVIYRYLITNLLAPYINERNDGELTAGNSISLNNNFLSEIDESKMRRFITCAPFYTNNANSVTEKVPKIFIKSGEKDAMYQLLVYNVLSSYMCIFIPETVELTLEFLRDVENFLKIKLTTFASELVLRTEKKRSLVKTSVSSGGNPFCYVYFNRLNLAQKNTLRNNKNNIPSEVLSLLSDVCFDRKRDSSSGETVVKTSDDFWVIVQFCNEREFYVISQQKNSTLIEIDDEMKKICEKQLKSIYFHA